MALSAGHARNMPEMPSARTPLSACAACGAPLCKKSFLEATVYTLSGPQTVEHVAFRRASKSCRSIHYHNYHRCEGKKVNSLAVEASDYIFVSATTGFCASFLRYHDALQFRGYVSSKAIARVQLTGLWPDDHSHARFNQDYGQARLLSNVITEFKDMWKLHSWKDKERLLRSIEIDNPLLLVHLSEYHVWWQRIATPKSLSSSVREFARDGHEKIAKQPAPITLLYMEGILAQMGP
ncbi:unnamed protein product [Durusdinium trenchii]|uniref:Uncharacterized protein n=2 Tax=Durusdinium trenchii TaxID=1381693 RepID=A0ABP0NJV5_9DINO